MNVHTKYKYNKTIYNHSQPCLTYKSLFKIIYKRIQNNNITLNTEKKLQKNPKHYYIYKYTQIYFYIYLHTRVWLKI